MKSLMIIGAGGFATEVEELARLVGYTDIIFLDDNIKTARCAPVVGSTTDIYKYKNIYPNAIIALGNNEQRRYLSNLLVNEGSVLVTLIHPTAFVSPDAEIGQGCVIREKAIVGRYVKLHKGVIINAGAIIDHDCEIGEYSHILVGSVVRNSKYVPPLSLIRANDVFE